MYITLSIDFNEPTPVFSGLELVHRTDLVKVLTHEKYSLVVYKDKRGDPNEKRIRRYR
jgi:hypothetical protein